jgi:hypothetical protein
MNPEAHKASRELRAAVASILQAMGEGEKPRPEDVATARARLEQVIAEAGGEPLPGSPAEAVEQFAEYFERTGSSIGLNGNVVAAVPRIARAWAQQRRL